MLPEVGVGVHELPEGLGEALGSNLLDVHGKHDQVEVSLDVVHDLEKYLFLSFSQDRKIGKKNVSVLFLIFFLF